MENTAVKLAIICSLCFTQIAFANHHSDGESMDSGKCEGMSHGNFSISGLDKNKDGNISKAEYLNGDKTNTEKVFKHIDVNNDGALDAAEQADVESVYKAIHEEYKSKKTNI